MFWIPSLRRCFEFLHFTAPSIPPIHEGLRFSGQHVVLLLRALEMKQMETWDCCYSSYNRTSDQNGDTSKICRGIVDQNAYLRIQDVLALSSHLLTITCCNANLGKRSIS